MNSKMTSSPWVLYLEFGAAHWLLWQFRVLFMLVRDYRIEDSCYSEAATDPC